MAKKTEVTNGDEILAKILSSVSDTDKGNVTELLGKILNQLVDTKNTNVQPSTKKHADLVPVVITTSKRGIFFGYAEKSANGRAKTEMVASTSGTTQNIFLKDSRNAYYFKCATGFQELAESGPKVGSKIGARVDSEYMDLTSIGYCTDVAVAAWESAVWSK